MPGTGAVRSCSGRTGQEKPGGGIHPYGKRAQRTPLVRFYASRLQSWVRQADRGTSRTRLFGYRKGAFPGAVQTRKGCSSLPIAVRCSLRTSKPAPCPSKRRSCMSCRSSPWSAWGRAARRRGRALHLFIVGGFENLVAQGAFSKI